MRWLFGLEPILLLTKRAAREEAPIIAVNEPGIVPRLVALVFFTINPSALRHVRTNFAVLDHDAGEKNVTVLRSRLNRLPLQRRSQRLYLFGLSFERGQVVTEANARLH